MSKKHDYRPFVGGAPADTDYEWCIDCGVLKAMPSGDPDEYFAPGTGTFDPHGTTLEPPCIEPGHISRSTPADPKEMTPEKLSEVYARAERWSSVPFDACGSFGDYIRKANAAHDWPGEDRDEVVRSSIDESADDPDEEVAGMLADALRLASLDRADLLAHIDFLTARLDDVSAESAGAIIRAESAESERAALIEGLGFVDQGPDGRGSGPVFVRGNARVFAGGYDGWVCQRGTISDHFDDLGFALAHAVTSEIEDLNAQIVGAVASAASATRAEQDDVERSCRRCGIMDFTMIGGVCVLCDDALCNDNDNAERSKT